MPADRTDIPENRRARHQLRAPALQDIDPGSRSGSATPVLASGGERRLIPPAASMEQFAPAAYLDPAFSVASGHGELTGDNNANWNMFSGTGGIFNNNPSINLEPGSSAVVNYAPVNHISIPDINATNFTDNKEMTLNDVMGLIGDRFISDALYDTQPKHAGCMSGTRESVLARIQLWIEQDPTRIFWLAGMAGTGKTSIALTLCRMLWDDPTVMLAGSFFCSRSAGSIDRTKVRHILPTLAATLASQYPEFAVVLAAELRADPRATQKPVSDQIAVLLTNPLERLAPLNCPITFVIDGLDECSDEREVAELLTTIADLEINPNVKFVVTSRPEMHIRGTPISNPDHNTILQLHTIKEEEVTIDIRRYITGTLEDAALATTAGWCTNSDIETLVKLCNGLFIFASTVLRYVLAREHVVGRKERLHKVMYAATHGSAVTTSLDRIYEMIVLEAARSDSVDADELRATQRVLASILSARSSLSVLALADLLKTNVGDVRGSLERLHSVVYMPDDDAVPGVRSLHASFGDYAVWRAADHVRIPTPLGDEILAWGCLHVMSKRLHFNVSQSDDSYKRNSQTRPPTISLSLEYACLEWIYHIAAVTDISTDTSTWDGNISKVLRVRFLFWLEVMSVLHKVRRASAMLIFAATTVRMTALANFLRDANKFVASSREAIERSAAHIYLSALPFTAKDSLVYQTFAPLCTGLISIEARGVDQHGDRLIMTLTGHSDWVSSVDCSSDGRHVVSGSEDGTVRIWDIRTGEETMPPLRCGGGRIRSVAFAPNGKTFAASTREGGVFIWNLSASHASLRWKYLSTWPAWSVTFSPDGSLVASACGDGIVCLWQVETGNIFTTLDCRHGKWIASVAFSPDGSKIVSVSGFPPMIQLWLVATGEPLGRPFQRGRLSSSSWTCFSPDGTVLAMQGQQGCVELLEIDNWAVTTTIRHGTADLNQMRFSPDGRSIVTASEDSSVYLSTISVEGAVSSPVVFNGHTGCVRSATFSHDGLYIVSCSMDDTIRIWDTGGSLKSVQTLSTHSDRISSVATSADGTLIVSGSHDRSVRVWIAHTGASRLDPLLGHTDAVFSVAISQDSRIIASGSADGTVRIWDCRDGRVIGSPLTGHDGAVNSVAFSPDSLWIISGSDDRTVRIWGVATGLPAGPGQLRCSEMVRAVARSPDGRLIAAGAKTGRIHIWHAATGQPVCASLENRVYDRHCICFSHDSKRIVSVGFLGSVAVWDVKTRQELLTFEPTTGWVKSVAFSHDGMLICSGSSSDGSVRIRDATTEHEVLKLKGHTGGVNSLALKPDGRSLVSCSDDRTIRVWDLAAARPRPSRNHRDSTTPLAFTTLRDGWLRSPSWDLLLWVPQEYRKHLPSWPCTMLIAEQCVNIAIGNEGWHRGTSWTSCWLEAAWKEISRS